MNTPKPDIQARLQALREVYAKQLPPKLQSLVKMWETLSESNWNWDIASELYRELHTLAGSASTFGFPEIGQQASIAEHMIKIWVTEHRVPETGPRQQFGSTLKQLSAEQVPVRCAPVSDIAPTPFADTKKDNEQHLIYIVDSDEIFSNELGVHLNQFDYRVHICKNSGELDAAMAGEEAAAIIISVALAESELAGAVLAQGIKSRYGSQFPIIFVSNHSDFESRLHAVRAGGDAYFVKPFDIAPLVDRLDQLTKNEQQDPYRILVVDDDQSLANHYSLLLQEAGMSVTTLSEPQNIFPAMADACPELILMDVFMPRCSGLELAKLIRQQDNYLGIPIVFLSSETNQKKQFMAMRMGADDFLTKPITSAHLISSVSIRVERSRILNTLMVKDSLTGLLKHTKIKEQLAIEVSRASRKHNPLCFVMLDIDHFKSVNDNYGHMVGDRVIKSLARLLQQQLRKTDFIGRYGGEEFAIVLPDCPLEQATQVINRVREDFSALCFSHNRQEFTVTVSAGIASFAQYHTPEDINYAADEALYAAKNNGRNCVKKAEGNKEIIQ
ncbi:MAG: diguanylate cyclase [Gammaproteobacteria bacterium]|nr:diguanylate cyclase [Gammaproteobacteria bacterium]